ncbi:MAG: cobalamin B12-binding domain-containing protein [Deltaproteobacteria bacterium]|nr:cobalamin B12-binding domain-containing protein [Deltaproteobacteria bacterium]
MSSELKQALADLNEEEALRLVKEQLAGGTDPMAILRACQEGMALVGERFEKGEYFISDLMMAGEILKQASDVLKPLLKGAGEPTGGRVVLGTVKGDIHDIGKDLVAGLLEASNFAVTDLGVDVPAERFVEALKETGATVLGLSGLLTMAFDSMRETVAAVEAAGLRSKVRVMIGGGPVDEKVCGFAKADAWGADAQAAVTLCKQWLEG